MPAAKTIPLIDPTFRGGLIEVPVSKTFDTKGRADFVKGTLQKDLSLCCLFQRGRCTLQERCHQIHVDTQFMAAVRQQNAHIVSCCRRCKDTASLTTNAVSFFATYFQGSCRNLTVNVAPGCDKTVDVELLAFTTGLESWLHDDAREDANTTVPTRKVCRLHLGGRCKYGKDCKYIHLCCQLGEKFLSAEHQTKEASAVKAAPAAAVSTLAPAATPVPVSSEPWRARTASFSASKTSAFSTPKLTKPSPAKNDFFDRVSQSGSMSPPEVSKCTTIENTPVQQYFTPDRFATPPTSHLPAVANPAEASGSVLFAKSNGSSCLERSIALTGLSFDPAMLWDSAADEVTSTKKADTFAASCELLSTTCSEASSMLSSRKYAYGCGW
jgi:hypothetical protein